MQSLHNSIRWFKYADACEANYLYLGIQQLSVARISFRKKKILCIYFFNSIKTIDYNSAKLYHPYQCKEIIIN